MVEKIIKYLIDKGEKIKLNNIYSITKDNKTIIQIKDAINFDCDVYVISDEGTIKEFKFKDISKWFNKNTFNYKQYTHLLIKRLPDAIDIWWDINKIDFSEKTVIISFITHWNNEKLFEKWYNCIDKKLLISYINLLYIFNHHLIDIWGEDLHKIENKMVQ